MEVRNKLCHSERSEESVAKQILRYAQNDRNLPLRMTVVALFHIAVTAYVIMDWESAMNIIYMPVDFAMN